MKIRGLWCILHSPLNRITTFKELKIIVRNGHKALARFRNGRKNANNEVNRWGLELASYDITFEWISGACNKTAADCLSHLVELPQNKPITINMLSATPSDGPAF